MEKREVLIREIEQKDNPQMALVIREVMPEFGATGEGFAIVDPEVDQMYETYAGEGSIYYVLILEEEVVGGVGIAPLEGADKEERICELQKMYFLPKLRGMGLGQKLMDLCLNFAKSKGYKACYIETLTGMDAAKGLYLKNGFKPLKGPLGNTGHFKCDAWYRLDFI